MPMTVSASACRTASPPPSTAATTPTIWIVSGLVGVFLRTNRWPIGSRPAK